jgi:hypothetical protein
MLFDIVEVSARSAPPNPPPTVPVFAQIAKSVVAGEASQRSADESARITVAAMT